MREYVILIGERLGGFPGNGFLTIKLTQLIDLKVHP